DQLHPVDPHLEVVVVAQRVDLLVCALNQDEAAQFRGLRLKDDDVETVDPPVLRETLEIAPCLVEQVEGLFFPTLRRTPPPNPDSRFRHVLFVYHTPFPLNTASRDRIVFA